MTPDGPLAPSDVTITAGGTGSAIQPVEGTPNCMSPEQLLGKPTDQRWDIYSLRLTPLQLATRPVAFEGHSFMCVVLSILTGQLPTPLASSGPLSAHGRPIARDPDARYGRVRDMRRDLASPVSVAAETPTVPGPGRPFQPVR